MRVQVMVTVDILFDEGDVEPVAKGDPLEARLQDSAVEAVRNAVTFACDNGFEHDLGDLTSVDVVSINRWDGRKEVTANG